MKKDNQIPSDSQDSEKDPGFRNVAKWIFLIAILVSAWFLMDWLISGK